MSCSHHRHLMALLASRNTGDSNSTNAMRIEDDRDYVIRQVKPWHAKSRKMIIILSDAA